VRSASSREFLLDISRLLWRAWRGQLPTGIDRVCLEYVAHFGSRSQAVVQARGRVFVLSPEGSDRLFQVFVDNEPARKKALLMAGAGALKGLSRSAPRLGMIYLNVGHTGLHDRALPAWIEANGVRAVYLIHDLIPITHPQFCRDGEAEKHRLRMENALASATAIIGNSKATLAELAKFASERGRVMPPAYTAWISGYRSDEKVEPIALERPHFVTVGTIEGRKNHLLLLRIWHRLVADLGRGAPLLVIVGQRGWKSEAATAMLDEIHQFDGAVRELGRCGDAELRGLLSGARALLMPSFAEGFGLPIIEALEAGTPVIASDLPVYREVVGGIPTYLDPDDSTAWESTIRAFAGDVPERERQTKLIRDYTAPHWAGHFAAVEEAVDRLPSRP
jgi:glycosyltransferase involved in cell wall biosynthesis